MNKLRLAATGVAIYLVLLLVHNLLIAFLTMDIFKRRFSQDAFSYAKMSARSVAEAYENYYASGYYKFRELVGDVMRINPDLSRLYLINVEGTVLFDSQEFSDGKLSRPQALSDPDMLLAVKGLDITCKMVKGADGKNYLDIIVPYLEEWGRHRVSVRYLVRYRSWGEEQMSLWLRIVLAGVISLGLGAAAIVAASARIAAGRERA